MKLVLVSGLQRAREGVLRKIILEFQLVDFYILSSLLLVKQKINSGFEVWEPHLMIELSLNPALYLMRKSLMGGGL